MSTDEVSESGTDGEPAVEEKAEAMTAAGDELMRFEDVSKHFGRVVAIEDVSLSVYENEILGIVGDNGAGKSTLMNVLSGVHRPTSGQLYYDSEPVEFATPSEARARGIETVYQGLALMDDLNIATNIFMGKFPSKFDAGPFSVIDWKETYARTEEIMEFLDQDLDSKTEVAFLSGGQRQLIAIARALSFDPDVFVLDEPTSALSIAGTDLVHETMGQLQDEGHTQIVVSHSIPDVVTLVDRIAVMYQGNLVDIVDPNETDREVIENLIISGRRTIDY